MKTCKQMRLENARALAGGSSASFAKRLEMSGQQANALIGPNPLRGIGDEKAREIEEKYGKEIGWLDHDHSAENSDMPNNGIDNTLSGEAEALIACVRHLDGVGELARKTFILHTGLLQVSSAFTELQTGSARSQMLAETDRLLASSLEIPSGATNERTPKKQ